MAHISVFGTGIAYELLGREADPPVVLTPGGRFSMTIPGLRELAEALVAAGRRVLIWDRPNCGLSDVCLSGASESEMQADMLVGLIRALQLGPTVIAGGSGGSRVSLLAAARCPEICSHLVVWWISGGPIGLMQLATYYCGEAATLASRGGMEAVLKATSWAGQFSANPAAKDAILKVGRDKFIDVMQRWAAAYAPSDISPVPGMKPADFARLTMPVLVFRSGASDLSHTRATSEWVHRLIPQSVFIDPPWGDSEWNERSAAADGRLFASWPRLAPHIVDFVKGGRS
jgi:pimeloyl-ACP methyl ester carboxylesterase